MGHSVLKHRMTYGVVLVAGMAIAVGCEGDCGTGPGAITLSITPTSGTVQQGGSAPVAATLTSSGCFTGAVTFTVSGAPTGVTAAVSNVATTGTVTTATVTIQVGVATALGTYNITVRGQGGGVTDATAAFALTVTAAPAFILTLSSPALTIVQGGNAPTTVSITRTNFTGGVTLTLENAPAGVTGAFNPTPATGTASTLTVSVGAAVAPGQYALTVRGAATGLTDRTATLTLTVPDYTLSLSPTALTIVQGATGSTTVTITRTNFTDPVTLSLGGAPAGLTGSFNPAAPTGTSSTLTVSIGASVTPGVYNLTVDGTGTAGNRSTPLTLTVSASCPAGGVCEQWAARATASSEYTETDWSANQATGQPNVAGCEDDPRAWASLESNGVDWLELVYEESVRPTEIRIHEVLGVSSIVRVEVKDGAGTYHTVYTAQPASQTCPRVLTIPVAGISAMVKVVRLSFDQRVLNAWNEIDAVKLIGHP